MFVNVLSTTYCFVCKCSCKQLIQQRVIARVKSLLDMVEVIPLPPKTLIVSLAEILVTVELSSANLTILMVVPSPIAVYISVKLALTFSHLHGDYHLFRHFTMPLLIRFIAIVSIFLLLFINIIMV